MILGSQANKKHFRGYQVSHKNEWFFKYCLAFLLYFWVLNRRFEIDSFHTKRENQNQFIKIIVTPFKFFVIRMKDIRDFLKWAIILSTIKAQLFLREANVFGNGNMRNKRTDWCELFWIVGHLQGKCEICFGSIEIWLTCF